MFFCATICKVYATPLDKTPAYTIGCHADAMTYMSGDSVISIGIALTAAQTKN